VSKMLEYLNNNKVDPYDDMDNGAAAGGGTHHCARMCIITHPTGTMVFSSIINLARYADVKYITAYHRLKSRSSIGGYSYRFATSAESDKLSPTQHDATDVVGNLPGGISDLLGCDVCEGTGTAPAGVYVPYDKQPKRVTSTRHTLIKGNTTYEFTNLKNAASYLGISSSLLIQYFKSGKTYDGWVILRDGKASPCKDQLVKLRAGEYVEYSDQIAGKNHGEGYAINRGSRVYTFKTGELAAVYLGVSLTKLNQMAKDRSNKVVSRGL